MLRRIVVIGSSGALGALALALVQIRVGALFGAGSELDAFFVGAALPSVLLAISAGAIANLVVPRLPAGVAALPVAGRYAALSALLGLLIAALVAVGAPLIVRIIAPGLDGPTADTATAVLRIYSISVPPTVLALVFTAYGFAIGRPYAAGLSTAVYGVVWTGLLFVEPFSNSVRGAVWAGVLATGLQLVVAFLLGSSRGARPWPVARDLRLSRVGVQAAGAVLGATIIGRVALLLDPLYGSLLGEGSLSQLSFATRITLLAVFMCGQGAALSLLVVTRDRTAHADSEARIGLIAPLLMSIAAAMYLLFAGPGLAELLLARGSFSSRDAHDVGELLRLYSPVVIVMTTTWTVQAVLFAAKEGRIVLGRATIGLLVNVIASGMLVALLGIAGRPLGVLAGLSVQLATLLWLMRDDERIAELGSRHTLRAAGGVAVGALLAMVVVYEGGRSLVAEGFAVVAAAAVVGFATFQVLRRYERDALARDALFPRDGSRSAVPSFVE